MTQIQVVVSIPFFKDIPIQGALSNLRKIIDVEAVPAAGQTFELPVGITPRITFLNDLHGHPLIHMAAPDVYRAMPPDSDFEACAELYRDLLAAGFSGVTDWDWGSDEDWDENGVRRT
jgi:hypothetical protein